jgi:AcrR family transcriptional regulator
MYTGNNPAALRSREYIVQTFLKLAETTPVSGLSIKRIMDASGLSRPTFYQIFETKEEILEYCMDRLFGDFMENVENCAVSDLCNTAQVFFAFFDRQKTFIRMMVQNGKSYILQRKCREYLLEEKYINFHQKGVLTDQEREYAMTFVANGMVGMLEEWLKADTPKESAQDLAHLVCRITNIETEAKNDGELC